jgi:hypothetical protein
MPNQFQAQGFALQKKLQRDIDRVNSDTSLSPLGKNEKIAALQEAARADLGSLRQAQQRDADSQRKRLEDKLFGHPTSYDPAEIVSRRDAAERVASLEKVTLDPSKAVELMKSAIRNGDKALERELLRAAYDGQWVDVINVVADARPSSDPDIKSLWDIRHPNPNNLFMDGLTDVGAFNVGDVELNRPGTPAMVTQNVQERRNALATVLGIEVEVDSTTGADGDAA